MKTGRSPKAHSEPVCSPQQSIERKGGFADSDLWLNCCLQSNALIELSCESAPRSNRPFLWNIEM